MMPLKIRSISMVNSFTIIRFIFFLPILVFFLLWWEKFVKLIYGIFIFNKNQMIIAQNKHNIPPSKPAFQSGIYRNLII